MKPRKGSYWIRAPHTASMTDDQYKEYRKLLKKRFKPAEALNILGLTPAPSASIQLPSPPSHYPSQSTASLSTPAPVIGHPPATD